MPRSHSTQMAEPESTVVPRRQGTHGVVPLCSWSSGEAFSPSDLLWSPFSWPAHLPAHMLQAPKVSPTYYTKTVPMDDV